MGRRLAVIFVVAWLAFWWGDYVGTRVTTSGWRAHISNNLQTLEPIAAAGVSNETSTKALSTLIEKMKLEEATLTEGLQVSVSAFLSYPFVAPVAYLYFRY